MIASFASRDEGPGSLSSETNVSPKSETVTFQNCPDANHGSDGAADYSRLYLARHIIPVEHMFSA